MRARRWECPCFRWARRWKWMRWSRSVAASRKAPHWLTQWEYAHRGLHGPKGGKHVPENSLAAARLAIEAGMGIECDIQRSRDDWPMVFHDWDLKQLTGEDGATESLLKEIGRASCRERVCQYV